MKQVYVLINDGNNIEGWYDNLKDAKAMAYSDCKILEVTSVVECEYNLKYKTNKVNQYV